MAEVLSPAQAASLVGAGARVGIGGLQGNYPMATLRALARGGVTDLDVVGPPVGMAGELLVAAGAVRSLAAPYMAEEQLMPIAPAFRHQVEQGRLRVWECDEGTLLTALRAAGQQLPFLPWRGGVGTSLPRLNPDLEEFVDEASGATLLRVPALHLDVAILRALEADVQGNVRYYRHSSFGDPAFARAARLVIVEVERLVPHHTVLAAPAETVLHRVDVVVEAPFGGHPFRVPGVMERDDAWLAEWNQGVRAAVRAGEDVREAAVVRRELEPADHDAYVAMVGRERLVGLRE